MFFFFILFFFLFWGEVEEVKERKWEEEGTARTVPILLGHTSGPV